ncbi:hypothetical protein ACIOG8_10410 [Streptomyces erythrochromogenes]|uniref:hypothetical protein n=1 Tax=Streptomyces erythrochromogenes TaxID=285574 RepID=UPI00380B8501
MTTLLLEALDAPLRVLRLFAAEYPLLPAPTVSVSTVYPDLLELSFHDDFSGFEAWRDVLGIAPGDVSFHVQGDGHTGVLKAHIEYAGASLRLVGFADVSGTDEERSRAEVVS